MTTEVDKITKAPKQNELIDTVNKIIDNLGSGGITVDGELSTTSENPVQNKVITQALADSTDVFWAEYGVTAYNDIKDALDANKIVVCNVTELVSGVPFVYTYRASRIGKDTTYIPNNAITFDCMFGVVNQILVCDTSSKWTSHNYRFAQEANVPTESTVSGWGFTKNIGTVTSVNNVQPVNGNVTLSIPQQIQANWNETDTTSKAYIQNKPSIPTVNQSFDGTSTNAESGVSILGLLQAIYPVGSVYLSTNSTCPLANYFGTWTLVSSGRALWTGYGSNGGSTISAGLPNITGSFNAASWNNTDSTSDGAFSCTQTTANRTTSGGKNFGWKEITINASQSNSIYGNSTTVQPPAYVVNVWRRTA